MLVVIGFRTSSNLAAAFGIAVTSTMAITTVLFAVVARERWRWSRLRRRPAGRLLSGGRPGVPGAPTWSRSRRAAGSRWSSPPILFTLMTTWKRGNALVFAREQHLEMILQRLLKTLKAEPPLRVAAHGVFFSANPSGAPAAMLANLEYNGVLHEQVLLMTVQADGCAAYRGQRAPEVEPLGDGPVSRADALWLYGRAERAAGAASVSPRTACVRPRSGAVFCQPHACDRHRAAGHGAVARAAVPHARRMRPARWTSSACRRARCSRSLLPSRFSLE